MTTIRDVAQVAEVSPSTVSYVLSKREGVNVRTRKRVEAAIQQLGYQRRGTGRPSPPKRYHIALVSGGKTATNQRPVQESEAPGAPSKPPRPGLKDHHWGATLRSALAEKGHQFHIFSGAGHVDHDHIFREAIEQKDIDGVILAWESPADGYLNWILEQGVPVLAINRRPAADQAFSYVEMNNFDGGWKAAKHLWGLGHRRMAVIQAETSLNYNCDRRAGFEAALSKHDATPALISVPDTDAELTRACEDVLNAEATAVFITTDTVTLRCLNRWEEMGLTIPDDLSVVGFDNRGRTSIKGNAPSSIGFDHKQMAETAVDMLIYRLRNPNVDQLSASIKTRMVEHDTTSPPSHGRQNESSAEQRNS